MNFLPLLAEITVPSGYFQLPIWVLVAILGIILSLIAIIYHKLDLGLADNAKDIKSNGESDTKRGEELKVLETRLNVIDKASMKREDVDRVWEESFNKEAQQVHVNTYRIDKLEEARNTQTKEELAKGGYVTMDKLMESNQKLMESFTKILSDKAESIEKNIALQIENMKLSLIANGKKKKGAK